MNHPTLDRERRWRGASCIPAIPLTPQDAHTVRLRAQLGILRNASAKATRRIYDPPLSSTAVISIESSSASLDP